jgi:hypothetical protein
MNKNGVMIAEYDIPTPASGARCIGYFSRSMTSVRLVR